VLYTRLLVCTIATTPALTDPGGVGHVSMIARIDEGSRKSGQVCAHLIDQHKRTDAMMPQA
jgi:hypothetical protein